MTQNKNANGQGHFKQLEDGRILYRKSAGVKSDGKRKILTVVASSKSACLKLMKEKEDAWEKEKNHYLVMSNTVVEDLCRKHLDFQEMNGELKPTSIDRRDLTIRKHIGEYPLGHKQIQMVTPADVEEHIGTLTQEGFLLQRLKRSWTC